MKLRTRDKYLQTYLKRGYIAMKALDDWYPTFDNHLVAVSPVFKLLGLPTIYRVCVWGADDFGMEKDFSSKKEAENLRAKIKSPITAFKLKELGMHPA